MIKEINIQDEQLNEGASKIEEITNMLSMTMRLTKFKVKLLFCILDELNSFQISHKNESFPNFRFYWHQKACGSLTTILKIRPEGEGEAAEEVGKEGEPVAGTATGDATTTSGGMATDLQGKMTDQLGKIGALFRKSDGA